MVEDSPAEIAKWMLCALEERKVLYQVEAVEMILRQFGGQFLTTNDSGNTSIRKDVLKEFRTISEGLVVWERGERMWRYREKYDEPGKRRQE
jgi:hypothetical protein